MNMLVLIMLIADADLLVLSRIILNIIHLACIHHYTCGMCTA